ncbi:hypothetical protein HDU67_005369 [Dinochytrium kinnereticum]|nr:hypothetical protein HDU67_005369 [Dinochytrium kinnereticum]
MLTVASNSPTDTSAIEALRTAPIVHLSGIPASSDAHILLSVLLTSDALTTLIISLSTCQWSRLAALNLPSRLPRLRSVAWISTIDNDAEAAETRADGIERVSWMKVLQSFIRGASALEELQVVMHSPGCSNFEHLADFVEWLAYGDEGDGEPMAAGLKAINLSASDDGDLALETVDNFMDLLRFPSLQRIAIDIPPSKLEEACQTLSSFPLIDLALGWDETPDNSVQVVRRLAESVPTLKHVKLSLHERLESSDAYVVERNDNRVFLRYREELPDVPFFADSGEVEESWLYVRAEGMQQ